MIFCKDREGKKTLSDPGAGAGGSSPQGGDKRGAAGADFGRPPPAGFCLPWTRFSLDKRGGRVYAPSMNT